jgi:hypothetical protein
MQGADIIFMKNTYMPVAGRELEAHNSTHAYGGVLGILYEECVEQHCIARVEYPPDQQWYTEVHQWLGVAGQGDLVTT